jgi:hypothetical protein
MTLCSTLTDKFKRYYSWNADLGVWSVSKQFGDIRHAQLPP